MGYWCLAKLSITGSESVSFIYVVMRLSRVLCAELMVLM